MAPRCRRRSRRRATLPTLLSCRYPDRLRLHVPMQPGKATALTPQPALLEPAERRIAGDAAVDGDLPGPDAARDGYGAVDVGAPDGAGKSVLRVVGDRHRLVVVAVAKDRQHWSEHFFLGYSGVGFDVGQDRGFEVEAGVQSCGA